MATLFYDSAQHICILQRSILETDLSAFLPLNKSKSSVKNLMSSFLLVRRTVRRYELKYSHKGLAIGAIHTFTSVRKIDMISETLQNRLQRLSWDQRRTLNFLGT